MLELFAKLLSNQQNLNQTVQNTTHNPSFDYYPKEAFNQNCFASTQNVNQSSHQSSQQSNPTQNMFGMADLLKNGNENNLLPLLLSLLGKSGSSFPLSSVLEMLTKKQSTENNNKPDDTPNGSTPIDDEILL